MVASITEFTLRYNVMLHILRSSLILLVLWGQACANEDVVVTRLTWSGVKMVKADTTVLIDVVGQDLWHGNAPGGLVPVTAETKRKYALVTHIHNDHFDVETLKIVLGENGYVICDPSLASYIASRGLKVIAAPAWQPVRRGGFLFIAVPAEDGFGDVQVSWVVQVDKKRFFHGGDTMFHGQLDNIGSQFGPFDVAFLPINGVVVKGEPASEVPVVMTPFQAINAAVLLRSKRMVPIHYGNDAPPFYDEYDDAQKVLLAYGAKRGLDVSLIQPGEKVSF